MGMPENATAAFGYWLELSLHTYGDALAPFSAAVVPAAEHVRVWRDFCYDLESQENRQRWAPFLLGVGASTPTRFTHDGLAFVKGLPQSVYFPQLLTWRRAFPSKELSARI